jgi:hypothetical protein
MNRRAIVLLSLLCNAGLLALAVYVRTPRQPGAVASGSPSGTPAGAASEISPRTNVLSETVIVNNVLGERFTWASLESPDYKAYIANLRAIGCPEQTIREIITADVNKLYASKFKELRSGHFGLLYWQRPPSQHSKEERDRQEKAQQLAKEKSALLTELLGEDTNQLKQREQGFRDHWDRMLGFLPEEKRSVARENHERFERQLQKMYRNSFQDDEDRKEIRHIQRERSAALAQVLSPEELQRYELNTSQVANQLRHDLDGFNPTEKEFRDLFQLRQAREDDLAHPPEQEVDAQVRSLIGDARFEEYKRAQDQSYKELTRLVSREELPPETAVTVYEMKRAAEDAALSVRRNDALTPEQRKEALRALRTETEASVSAQLGEKGLKSYKRSGGYWMNNLER